MEQINHLEAAILAAGVTCVYNADDWERMGDKADDRADASSAAEGSVPH